MDTAENRAARSHSPLRSQGLLKSYPSALSGGMRQRAALIRTLAVDPDVLLLDEPFSALDYQTRLSVCDDVYKIIRSEHKTAVLITHDISEAVSVADKIVVLSRRPARVVSRHTLSFPENEPLSAGKQNFRPGSIVVENKRAKTNKMLRNISLLETQTHQCRYIVRLAVLFYF
ncbi:MAG: ATP-binding cassette domain-containing protein [Christensenellaceae bacterium]